MCFSLLASVAVGVPLTVAGAVTVKMARRRAELPLALVPLLFGVQQLIEGVVWWSLHHNAATLNSASSFVYTLFSHVLWPFFVPFTYLCMESARWRRKVLAAFLGVGAVVGSYGGFLVVDSPSPGRVTGSSIQYEMPPWYFVALYLLATCFSAFLSSEGLIKALGAAALVLALISLWLYTTVFVSVWCFFSAILTGFICVHFLLQRTHRAVAVERVWA
jgi:hypothetical protein